MRILLLVLATSFLFACSEKERQIDRSPHTPPLDSLLSICTQDLKELDRIVRTSADGSDTYLIDRKTPFTGWACQDDHPNSHRYRFAYITDGKLQWQIGYYAGGQLDHDFRLKDGRSMGSERMWKENGQPYIDQYYSSPGKMHGIQRRWHNRNILAREALFEHGTMIYEKLYDKGGRLIETKGDVPEEEK